MKNSTKSNLLKFLLIGGLVLVILFAVITSIVLNDQRRRLEEVKEKNEQVKPKEETDKIILKNFQIFIDNEKYF